MMNLETENRIAAILLKEADELRRQAQKEGALAYLREPTVRSRPNSRFLTATVRGVQQANRAVEVNEMWRIRDKQLELEKKLRGSRNETSKGRSHRDGHDSHSNKIRRCSELETTASTSHSSKKRTGEDLISMDTDGLRDEEIEEFLHSRTKRGRGAVGSRMDERGPYPPSYPDSDNNILENIDEKSRKSRVRLGPEKPSSLNRSDSSDEEFVDNDRKKIKRGSSKRQSKKHKSREKSRDKKKKRKEKRNKHYK